MNRRSLIALALLAFGLAACQSFGGATSEPGGSVNPPVNAQMPATPGPIQTPMHATPSAGSTTPPGSVVTYAVADAPKGFKCPQDQGFSCNLYLQFVTPAPSGSPSASPSGSASPSPTPSPMPSPTASGSSSSPSPSPSPAKPGAHVTFTIAGLPKNVPSMKNPDPKAVATVPLIALRMVPDSDVVLAGTATAAFTLPKEQIGGRGFAVQLYHETISRKKTNDTYVASYSNSKLSGTTLTFSIPIPPLPIKKNDTWLFVLYGDELPSSPSPSASPSAHASPTASAAASALPSTSPAASTSPSSGGFPVPTASP